MQRKWVAITHRQLLHEVAQYPTIAALRPGDKMLQHSGVMWGAAALGQIDIALAFACTVCLTRGRAALRGTPLNVRGGRLL